MPEVRKLPQPDLESLAPAVSVGSPDLATAPAGAGGLPNTATASSPSVRAGAAAAKPSPPGSAPDATSSPQSVDDAVAAINGRLSSTNRILQLSVDAAGITIAQIKNAATGQVLQQIPSNDLVRLAEMLSSWSHDDKVLLDLIA